MKDVIIEEHQDCTVFRGTYRGMLSYRDNPAISQSFLKDVVLNGKAIGTDHRSSIVGDIVDAYLTIHNEVDSAFTVYTGPIPSDKLTAILEESIAALLRKNRLTDNISDHKNLIMKIADDHGFDSAKKRETRWESIMGKASDWWTFMVTAAGKQVITERDRSFGDEIAKRVLNCQETGIYFHPFPGRDFYYQIPIFFEYKGVHCKAMPDIVVVSHAKKTIYDVEIKTIFQSTYQIISRQIKEFGYTDQLSFYREALTQKFADLISKGYKIESKWMFIPKDIRYSQFYPVIWPCSHEMMDWAKWGGHIETEKSYLMRKGGSSVKRILRPVYGWDFAIDCYNQTIENGWEYFNIQAHLNPSEELSESFFFN